MFKINRLICIKMYYHNKTGYKVYVYLLSKKKVLSIDCKILIFFSYLPFHLLRTIIILQIITIYLNDSNSNLHIYKRNYTQEAFVEIVYLNYLVCQLTHAFFFNNCKIFINRNTLICVWHNCIITRGKCLIT